MASTREIQDIVNHATGTENYHRFSAIPGFPIITDGVLRLAETAGCYWFLDIIGSHQNNQKLDKAFQVWTLAVNRANNSAVVKGHNDTLWLIAIPSIMKQ